MNTFFKGSPIKLHIKQIFDKKIIAIFLAGILIGYGISLTSGNIDQSAKNTNEIKGVMADNPYFNIFEFVSHGFTNDKAGIKWTVLAEDKTSGIEIVSIKDTMPNHIHKTEDHFTYVISGNGDYIQSGKTISLEPGKFILTPMKTPHRIVNKGKEPLLFLVFSTPLPFREDDIEWVKNP